MQAAFDIDRSMRLAVGRAATLRDHSQTPVDLVVVDVSRSGCLVRAELALAPGDMVSIGIPGLGTHRAEIGRADHPDYGCVFLTPIGIRDIAAATRADTLVQADFPARNAPVREPDVDPDADMAVGRYSLRTRSAMIVGSAMLLWAPIVMAGKLLAA